MCPAAARLNDPIAHTSTMGMLAKMGGSLLVGALVGAAITALVVAAVVATVATGGLGLAAVLAIGFGVSMAMEASGLNGFIDSQVNRACDKFIPPSIEGKIITGSPNVKFDSLAAARAASPGALDTIVCNKHGGAPPMLAQGSDNVFINSQPAARIGDMTTCGGTIAEGSATVFVGGGTVTVREINDEKPWWITALGVGIGVALTLCGRGKMNLSSLKAALPCLMKNLGASLAGSYVGSQLRTTMGNPVNVITGGKVLREQADFSLPGPMPLDWARFYSSHDDRSTGLLGQGWSLPYEVSLTIERAADGAIGALYYSDYQGRRIPFPPIARGECHYSVAEGYYLICTELGQYLVESTDGLYRDFGVPAPDYAGILPLQRLEDRNGNWQALDYDADGRLAGLRDNCERQLDFRYDPLHPRRVASIDLRHGAGGEIAGPLLQYRYTPRGLLAEVIDRAGSVTRRFAYDPRSALMTQHSVPGGLHCFYEWSGSGAEARVERHWTNDGESYEFRYHLAQGRTTVRDQLDRAYQWEWNADGQPTTYTDPEGHTWRYAWNEQRQLVKAMDPAGATTRFEYDERGRQTTAINALDQISRIEWHPRLDLPTSETDAAGGRWTYAYDERGNAILVTDPEGCETEHFFDVRGLPHTIRDARNGYKHLEWDSRALLTAYTDCSGQRTSCSYDAQGTLIGVTDALGNVTRYETDELGRVVGSVLPDGSVERVRYDDLGRIGASIDPAERVTEYQRNIRGMLTRRVDPTGRSVQFIYDAAFRLEALVNENGESYRFVYDRNDNLIEEIGLDGIRRRIEHDACGQPCAVVYAAGDAESLAVRLERDALGRLTAKHARDRSTAYRYDQMGRLLEAQTYTDQGLERLIHDKLSFAYSKRGELVSEAGHMGSLRHAYDELGNRISTTLPDGRTINRLHYGSGHLHQFNIDGEVISDIERDGLHREVMRSQGRLATGFGYDRLGRKTWEQSGATGGPASPLRKEWRYDIAGELAEKQHSHHGVTRYLYDPLGRITYAAQEGRRELFAWDAAANLVDSTHVGGYIRHNRVMVFEDKRFEYDDHGRLETKWSGRHTVQRFAYDGEHRLTQVVTERDGMHQSAQFDYDAIGRRIRKHDAFGTTHFLWDGLQMLQEQRGAQVATYFYEPGTYVPLARIDGHAPLRSPARGPAANEAAPEPGNAGVYYFHNDVSGLPEELTAASGELVWQAQYATWGNTISESWSQVAPRDAAPLPQNLRLQGQYLDRDTGLHYNTFRFYDPDIGRFISPDPIGLEGSTNWFAYAPNPISWIDPLGWAGKGDYGKMPTIPGYQKHHIIPQGLANHPAILASGYDVHSSANIVYLPTSGKVDPARTVHRGRHEKLYDRRVAMQLDAINSTNAAPAIKRMQIQGAVDELGGLLRTKQIRLNSAC